MEKFAIPLINNPTLPLGDRMLVLWKVCAFKKDLGEERIVSYIKRGLALSENSEDPDVLDIRHQLMVKKAVLVDKDLPAAFSLKKKHLPDNWQQDTDELCNLAVWCYSNKTNANEAFNCLKKSLEFAEDSGREAQCHYLLGVYSAKREDYVSAIS